MSIVFVLFDRPFMRKLYLLLKLNPCSCLLHKQKNYCKHTSFKHYYVNYLKLVVNYPDQTREEIRAKTVSRFSFFLLIRQTKGSKYV